MKRHFLTLSVTFSLLLCLACLSGFTEFSEVSDSSEQVAMHIQGIAQGGQQALNGAHIYMYAASTGAYGGDGIAASTANVSKSLLTASSGTASDGSGNYYVTTDQQGNFNIKGAFDCTPGTQVYLYSSGGDPQVGGSGVAGAPNPAATLLAVVGPCASASPSSAFPGVTFVFMNEISTVTAAYALAGFTTDPLHIGAPSAVTGHSLSATGIANAFKGALNITNQATGLPLATTPAGNGTVPVTTINTLADILAVCVNSTGASSNGCSSLFSNAKNSSGAVPADTATAAINIAQHPGANVSNLLGLVPSAPPFAPTIQSANDFTLGVQYTGGGLNYPSGVAIDSLGNVWVTNYNANSVTEMSTVGSILSGTSGYTGGGLNSPYGIAIDSSGNAWVSNYVGNSVTKISNSGSILSGASGYTGGGLDGSAGIAIDGGGNVWVANLYSNSVTKISNSGSILSGGSGYTGGGLNGPAGIAVDGSGNVWVSNYKGNSLTKISNSGSFLSGTSGYTGGGLNAPTVIAIDGSGNTWVDNNSGTSVTKISNSGSFLSGASGYNNGSLNAPGGLAIDGSGNAWVSNHNGNSVAEISNSGSFFSGASGYSNGSLNAPYFVAGDGSGNIWISNQGSNKVTELIGAGAPIITPLVASLPATPTSSGISNYGTRP